MVENLGNRLRGAREAAGLEVDDAVYRAKLPRAVVEALEADDYGFFTSPLYARSFLKQYGDYVGLDVTSWLGDLVPTAMIGSARTDVIIGLEESAPQALRGRQKKREGAGSMAALWLIVITVGLIWGGVQLFMGLENQHTKAPAAAPETAATPDPVTPEQENTAEEKKPIPTNAPEPAKRAIIVQDE